MWPTDRYLGHLIGGGSWFDVPLQEETANALVTFDGRFIGGSAVIEHMRGIKYRDNFPFGFDLALDIPCSAPRVPGQPEYAFCGMV